MFFQLLDNKIDCAGVYVDGQIVQNKIPEGLTRTWAYSEHLYGKDIDYANLMVSGKSITDVCPEHLKEKWEKANKTLKANFKSIITSKIELEDVCFYDLLSPKDLRFYFGTKDEITRWVFENCEKPKNYNFLKQTLSTISEIKKHPVKIDLLAIHLLAEEDNKAKYLYEQFEGKQIFVDYNLFGTVTGRLTTKKDSFPILNLKSELKEHVIPNNDVFLELDFNAAEVRTLLALQNIQQPEEDIHEWNIKNVFKREMSREEAKQKLFAWLYNPESKSIGEEVYDRESILNQYYGGGQIQTPFGRTIDTTDAKALNYLLQSTSSDNTIDRANKISSLLRATRSHIAFIIHDSIVIDLHRDDKRLIPKIKEIFENTRLGKFKVNLSIGKNLGNMREFAW